MRKFELSELSNNTIEKDEDEIGSHLKQAIASKDKTLKKSEHMPNISIQSISKQQI